MFQSPFHRVKGCNSDALVFRTVMKKFQSPFHRVKGCNQELSAWIVSCKKVSIPFSSGQRMQLHRRGVHNTTLRCFNPLFIGSKDATMLLEVVLTRGVMFQSPFHRVKGCNEFRMPRVFRAGGSFNPLFIGSKDATGGRLGGWPSNLKFQSPFHRVKGCNGCRAVIKKWPPRGFNPLFIGSKDATMRISVPQGAKLYRFNPLFIGSKDATLTLKGGWSSISYRFNPLFIGSKDATRPTGSSRPEPYLVSIPFSSGQRMQPRGKGARPKRRAGFQSPFHRVKGCNWPAHIL